jgi:LmbE family N-acetylglucosaminyl deacetylase
VTDRAILGCYAHPDDEQGMTGTMLHYGARGVRTGLACATRGEMGEVSDPALATSETIGSVREAELRRACEIGGIQQLWFLDYHDSGMAGTDGNRDPRAFINADEREAVGKLVAIIREFKPTIMTTFEPSGGYGHPDHLAIHRWATLAYHAAGDAAQYPDLGAAWQPARLYYSAIPRSALRRMLDMAGRDNPNSPFRGLDVEKFGVADEDLTHVLDVSEFVEKKIESVLSHATQYTMSSPMFAMPKPVLHAMRSKESYLLAAGVPLPADYDRGDLFAGLD